MKFNKKTGLVAFAAIMLVAGGTATVMEYFASSSGTVDVDESVTTSVDTISDSVSSDTAGDYFQTDFDGSSYMTLDNNRDELTRVDLLSEYREGSSGSYSEEVEGAVTHNYMYEENEFSESDYDAYVRADSSDVEEDYEYEPSEIGTAIEDNEKVLVESRDSAYTVESEVGTGDSVIESTQGATATEINFDDGQLEANGHDLEVRGFTLTGTSDSSEGVVYHTTDKSDLSGSLVLESNMIDTDEPYRDVWTEDTETNEFSNNFFYGGNTDAAAEVNLENDEGEGSVDFEDNTFVSYPVDQKVIALRTHADSTDTQEVTGNNFVYVGHAIEQNEDAEITDSSGNYFASEDDSDVKGFDSADEPSFNDEADNPVTDGIKDVPVNDTVNLGQVNYISGANEEGEYGFETTVSPAP